jgi:PAS domain S-box-containing protein
LSRLTLAFGLALLALETALAVALIAASEHEPDKGWTIGLAVTAGVAFVVSGLVALARRPENRTGVYMASVGYLWFLGALAESNDPWIASIGYVLGGLAFAPFTALLLSYPTGRFGSRFESALPLVVGGMVVGFSAATVLIDPTPVPSCEGCPENVLLLVDSPRAVSILEPIAFAATIAVSALVVILLIRRWRRAAPPLRRALWPVLVAGGLAVTALLVASLVAELGSEEASNAITPLFLALFAAVPVTFLVGVLRTRLARSSATDVVVALEEGAPLRDALAEALGDPSLTISYRLAGSAQWVDAEGRSVPEPAPSEGRAQTTIERGGLPIAVLDYDAYLADDPQLVDAVAAAAGLSLQNERLNAGLRAQYTFLETVTDTAPSLLVNVGTDGRILNQNRAAVAVSGAVDQEHVRGLYFWDVFIDPGERQDVVERFQALKPEFAPAEYENTFTNQRGEKRIIYWRTAPVRDEAGSVVSIIAGGLDITERHQLEEEKERERAFLNAIANNAPSLICLIDHEGRVTERGVNIAFERTLEYNDREVGGRVFWETYVDPDEADEVRARIRRVVAGEAVPEHDNVWVTSSGRKLVIAWTCTALPRIDERTLFLISGVDVTERQRREEMIRAGEERLRAAIQGAPVAIVELGLDDRVRLWNPAAERIFGWPAEEVVGGVVPVVPPDRQGEFRGLLGRIREGDAYTGFETVRMRRDGTLVDVEISAAPIRDAAGAVVGHMAVFSDISDRKRQEEELRASRARLVAAADEARQQLERNLHDGAQQRLVALSVTLRLAESQLSRDPDAAAAIVAGAREELTHALEELRELARGIHPAVLTDRGLSPAVDALVARTPVPVEVEVLDGRLPAAVEAASYYVVAEALTNVAKYAGASGASVQITREDGRVVIQVADDGAGGADPAHGSGLRGLADRIAALDGTLAVESPAGKGTVIRAEIPLPESTAS